MTARRVPISWLFVAAVALSVVAASLVAGAGVVGANHGEADADYTVEPMDDRSPGASDVKYGQIVVGQAGVDLETLESMKAVYEEGSWEGCGPGDGDVFGIDRGNTHDGYEVDEDLEENTKSFTAGEDVFRIEFYGEDDFGPSTHLNDGDAVVSVAECIDNPDEPGWYQITGSTTGVTEDGERVTISGASHYFWVCDCEDESEAREELGPPPSEGGDGGSATATPSGDGASSSSDDGGGDGDADGGGSGGDGDANDGGSGDDGAADDESSGEDAGAETQTADDSADGGSTADDSTEEDAATGETTGAQETPEATESMGAMGEEESGESSQAAATGDGAASWENRRVRTPTPGTGDGFGGPVAIVALVGAAVLLVRRR